MKRQLIFLGAGASIEAGLPSNAQLTDIIVEDLKDAALKKLYFEIDADLKQRTGRCAIGLEDVCAELDRLSAVETSTGLWTFSEQGRYYSILRGTIHVIVCHILGNLPLKNNGLGYLHGMIKAAGVASIPIFTVNVDCAVELVCTDLNVALNIGVKDGGAPDVVEWGTNYINLGKLHGSVNWALEPSNDISVPMIVRVGQVYQSPSEAPSVWANALSIYGFSQKFRYDPPFKQIYRNFDEQLRDVEEVRVLGYSFSDPHVNSSLYWWLQKDETRSLEIANGSEFETSDIPRYQIGALSSNLLETRARNSKLSASEAIRQWWP